MKGYTFGHVLKERGAKPLDLKHYTEYHKDKKHYVEDFLSIAVEKTRLWRKVEYIVLQFPRGEIGEYLVLYSDDAVGARYINVTANSLGAIFSSLGENIW